MDYIPEWKLELIRRWERYLEINPHSAFKERIKNTILNLKKDILG